MTGDGAGWWGESGGALRAPESAAGERVRCPDYGAVVLHGLYDTMLKKEYNVSALGVALASFVYLSAMVEWSRQKEVARLEATQRLDAGVGAAWAVA